MSQVQLQITDVDLSAMARSVLADLQELAPQRESDLDIQQDLRVKGDTRLLRPVMENLLGNAWKSTSAKDLTRISFTAHTNLEGVTTYCIKDNGVGFSMLYADKLFRSFQRLHS